MFAEPVWIPCRAIAGGGQEPVVERKDDVVQPGSPHLRGQRGAILTPDIVLKPLLPVIVIPRTTDCFGAIVYRSLTAKARNTARSAAEAGAK